MVYHFLDNIRHQKCSKLQRRELTEEVSQVGLLLAIAVGELLEVGDAEIVDGVIGRREDRHLLLVLEEAQPVGAVEQLPKLQVSRINLVSKRITDS